ncbi:MAG: DEAD/DEAH box helicase [Crocinitomicaceae bacterium]|jgi:superfamily II DNA/RNA helicase|nr:DEAD/DEAH box helicase [Crocinitomicaceae bacterium]MBT5401856.1 DEAD/DEAH box helicase [Crocinitomicaceae bacterium]MBT6514542.1 DEAD/DEAH box helicase [Crocinitomicaceae bacterium]MBT7518725.1 DEAD/DEAH box helicase [Candidatus Neomarinimicrobiota bacterium]
MKFEEFEFEAGLMESLNYMGFVDATPIQESAIPIVMRGEDLIGCAQTGTGKTGAFLLPVINAIMKNPSTGTRVLVVVPTRELAIQIDQQMDGFSYTTNVSSMALYGGTGGDEWVQTKKNLELGVDVLIATPGKLLSHLQMGHADLSGLSHLVLDEADRMLDIGFHDDILRIISFLPKKRQNLMFSATMPTKIRSFAKRILNNPQEITMAVSKPAEGVLQAAYYVEDEFKVELVNALITEKQSYESIIIFASTKKDVKKIVSSFKKNKLSARGISSDLEQSEREEVLRNFKAKKFRIIVATDVISRGIDIKGINLVINYNVPKAPEDYVHRIGRTARANTTGVALTLVNSKEKGGLKRIEKLIENSIYTMPYPN